MALHLHLGLGLRPAPNIAHTVPSATPGAARSVVSLSPASRVRASFSAMRGGRRGRRVGVVVAMADGEKEEPASAGAATGTGRMNLNEYMVAVDRPLGVRFALAVDGRVFVHSLMRGGNAEKSRIIMVGDTLKKASNDQSGGFVSIKDLGDTEMVLKEKSGPCNLVLERPFTPYPIHQLHQNEDYHILFNRGRVSLTTWNSALLSSKLNESSRGTEILDLLYFPQGC